MVHLQVQLTLSDNLACVVKRENNLPKGFLLILKLQTTLSDII